MIKAAMIRFDKLMGETSKAYLIKIRESQHWVPKSMCRNFITNQKLGGNVILPTFIINQIIGFDINDGCPDFITPTWVIEHHIPELIKPVENNTIPELKK